MSLQRAHELELVGGRLCLDFVNTAAWHDTDCLYDHVTGPDDLVRWAHKAGLLTAERTAELIRMQHRQPYQNAGAEALAGALLLRATCRRLLLPGVAARQTDLATLERVLRELGADLRLALAAGEPAHAGPNAPGAWLLLPIAISTIELLTSPDRLAIGSCAGERCGWLFLDRSRKRNRVWCSMQTCGNRAKAKAHYARQRRRAS